MSDKTDLHNRLVGPIVASIVKPVIESGGEPADALVLLESVIAGTVIMIAKLGGDEPVIDTLAQGVKARLASIRLGDADAAGSA